MLRTISNVREYEISQFIAGWKFERYYVCNSCSKPISVSTGKPVELTCLDSNCGALNLVEFMTYGCSIEAMYTQGDDKNWVVLHDDVFSKHLDLSKVDNLAGVLMRWRAFSIQLDGRSMRVLSMSKPTVN